MRPGHFALLVVVAALFVTTSSQPVVAQRGPNSAASMPSLPYKLVDWPVQLMGAAGFPLPWNFIQVSSVAITQRGTVLVLHRGAHPILEFDQAGKLIRSWGDGMFSEGKVAAIPQPGTLALLGCLRACWMRLVRRAFGPD
jgi:hypothetical protein